MLQSYDELTILFHRPSLHRCLVPKHLHDRHQNQRYGNPNIKDQYKPEIAKVAEKLSEYPNATARIEGHTDNTGPRKLNERLSLARANSVKSALVNEYNVDASRLSTQGFAWDQPIADNKTKEGRAMNRRVFATITGSRTVVVQPGQEAAAPAAAQ
ncbi:OmpA family protein [Klebsiella pneumoniae]